MKQKLHPRVRLKVLRPLASGDMTDDRRAEPRAVREQECGRDVAAAWFVVETKRYQEQLAHRHLGERGLQSYCPRVLQWPEPRIGGPIGPLFPGYLFVHLDGERQFHAVARTPGVKGFVTFGGVTPSVDTVLIEELRDREGPVGVIRCEDAASSEVRITEGPLRGFVALVERRLPARQRVCVLMELLQRQTLVELPERWVRRA
jgi:Transcription termination factor nusG